MLGFIRAPVRGGLRDSFLFAGRCPLQEACPSEQGHDSFLQVLEAGIARSHTGYEHNVRPTLYAGGAHSFSEAPLETVPSDCISDTFTCYEREPAGIQVIGNSAQHQQLICHTAAVLANSGEVLTTRKPLRSLHLGPLVA